MTDHASRFVFSGPGSWPLERAIEWAVEHGFSRVDFNADGPPNYPATFTPERVGAVRALAEGHGVQLGIHSLSAVNMAQITPVMAAAADEYVRQNLDLAKALGCGYVICHGGFHFSSDYESRFAAAIERMERAAAWAEERGLDVYFENHNAEPELLVPEGYVGFLDAFGVERIGQVRLHDTNGEWEEHFLPGDGIVDFPRLFRDLQTR